MSKVNVLITIKRAKPESCLITFYSQLSLFSSFYLSVSFLSPRPCLCFLLVIKTEYVQTLITTRNLGIHTHINFSLMFPHTSIFYLSLIRVVALIILSVIPILRLPFLPFFIYLLFFVFLVLLALLSFIPSLRLAFHFLFSSLLCTFLPFVYFHIYLLLLKELRKTRH